MKYIENLVEEAGDILWHIALKFHHVYVCDDRYGCNIYGQRVQQHPRDGGGGRCGGGRLSVGPERRRWRQHIGCSTGDAWN